MSVILVGDAWGEQEAIARAPFVGPAGKELRSQLRDVGVDDYHLTNVFNFRPPKNSIAALCTKNKFKGIEDYPPLTLRPTGYVKEEYTDEISRLFGELSIRKPKVVIALGNTALWALTRQTGIGAFRGYDLQTIPWRGQTWPVIATWHPAAVLRSYPLRTIALCDINKAVNFERRDIERTTLVPESIADLQELQTLPNGVVACDIETTGQHATCRITEVGFAFSESLAATIPFETLDGKSYWKTSCAERAAWKTVADLLARCPTIGHNFSYDMQYLWRIAGIPSPNFIGDTMLLHHAIQPELRKSLGFLASLYTSAPRWKHIRTEQKELDA